MLKRNLFLILSLLIAVILFLTAATCNMCGVSVSDEEEQQTDAGENTVSSSQGSSTDSQASQDSAQDSKADDPSPQDGSNSNDSGSADPKSQDSQQNGNSNDQKNYDIEITDIVLGDVVDEHVEPAAFFFTDSYYTCYPVINTQLDGTETFDWSVSGGSCDNGGFYMQWNTPSDEGYYTVSLNVHMGDAWGFYNKDFYVEPQTAMGPPLEGPQITGIEIIDEQDNVVDVLDINTKYEIKVSYTDPNSLIWVFDWKADSGEMIFAKDNSLWYRSPDFETQVTITVILIDHQNENILQESFTLNVIDI